MSRVVLWFKHFWIACCALALVAQTRLLLGISIDFQWVDGFIFGGTVFGYHFRHRLWAFRISAWCMGCLGGICLWMAFPDAWMERLILLAPVLGWVMYYGGHGLGRKGLRGYPIAKPLTIALVWAWVTVLLPVSITCWPKLVFLFLGRASFIFALALAYDLGDMERDRTRGFSTLAGRLGLHRTFVLIYWSLGISALCVGMNGALAVYGPAEVFALLTSLAISVWWLRYLLHKSTWMNWQKPLIDGLMVMQFVLVALVNAMT